MKLPALLLSLAVPLTSFATLPDIILMMSDDQGWEETGYNGHPHVKTPVLDEMAANGLNFERFYAYPTCSPTRAKFLTGRDPNRMGVFGFGWSLRPEEISIAHIAAEAGYYSAHLGKWHVGAVKAESPVNPGGMGFDEWLSHDNFFEMDPPLSRNGGPPEIIKGEGSEIMIAEAIEAIGRARAAGKPAFIVIWFGSPHEPYSGLPEDLALYDHIPAKYDQMVNVTCNDTGKRISRPQGEVLRERYAEITAMDRAIGTLRDYLVETGTRDNTLLLFCGDNGTSGDAALGGPFREAKGSVYEGGILVPCVIEWPARFPEPRTTSVRATVGDLLPTIATIVGQPLPDRPLDGIDLNPVFDGELTVRPTPIATWVFDRSHIRRQDLEPYIDPELQRGTTPLVKLMGGRFTRNFNNVHHPGITEEDYGGRKSFIVGDHKLVIHPQDEGDDLIELFNLKDDLGETTNLATQKPEMVEELSASLRTWQESVLHSLMGNDYR